MPTFATELVEQGCAVADRLTIHRDLRTVRGRWTTAVPSPRVVQRRDRGPLPVSSSPRADCGPVERGRRFSAISRRPPVRIWSP